MKFNITQKNISEVVRFIAVLASMGTALITKDVGNAFLLVVGISGIIATFFSPGFFLNTATFNFFKKHQKSSTKN